MNASLTRLLCIAAAAALLAASPPPSAVKVVTYGTGMGAWCFYAADDQHYFDAANVKLASVFSLIGDPNIVSALTSGQADVAIGSVGAIVPFANGETDQIVVIASSEGAPLSLVGPKDVTSLAQLAGKTIALPAHNGSNTLISEALLNAAIGAGKWTPLYTGGPTSARLAAVDTGRAAAAILSDPFDLNAGGTGTLHVLSRFGERAIYWNGPVFSTRSWLGSNRIAAVGFLAAFARGCNFILDPKNKQTAIALLAKETPISAAAAADAYDYWVAGPGRGTNPPRDGRVDLPKFANSMALLKAAGVITNKAFDYRTAMDPQYLDEALKTAHLR